MKVENTKTEAERLEEILDKASKDIKADLKKIIAEEIKSWERKEK